LIAAHRAGPGGKVVSVEPTPSTMHALRTTLTINGLAEIAETHELALGAEEGTATLYCVATSGHNSLLPPDAAGTRNTQVVKVTTGDVLLKDLKPTLIKIDVEGWELEVLKGLERTIKRVSNLSLVVEYSPEHIRRRGLQPAAWLESLRNFGLDIWLIDDADVGLRPLDASTKLGEDTVNLFLARKMPSALKGMVHDQ
jgi:FkbM family methyltransferase